MGTLGLIMITLIYAKQIIHLSGPVDENSFFARDRFILVLGQKGDLTTGYPQTIWYASLPLKCTNMHLFTDKISAMNFMGYNLGQKVGDKLMKLSKIGLSMECFTADVLQFFTEKRQNLAFGWTAEYLPSNPRNPGIFLKFTYFLRS